ncbi:histidine protein methyltransferase 1 homolog isoform X2 [Scaptodrosophila lebanonensis]|nr:histidine protein methyltransferase 1 homolog isoform X2 [Scaptodrosophila lebanonensis]
MFKFNFEVAESSVEELGPSPLKKIKSDDSEITNSDNDENCIKWYLAEKVIPTEALFNNLDLFELNLKERKVGTLELRHLIAGFLLEDIKTHSDVDSRDIKKSEESHSDLITGVYEGGAKIWECTDDLLLYLSENIDSNYWADKRVLDLGCGAGLLGIYALKSGAKIVDFQDYNKDVLEQITLPNVLLNLEQTTNAEKLKQLKTQTNFYAGDWAHFAELTDKMEKYNIILTSETIYNIENQQKLLDTLKKRLALGGVVLVAAKSHYFGVGGGLEQFIDVVNKDQVFKAKNLWQASENLKRGILELKWQ